MLLVEGRAAGVTLTGTLYGPDDDPPEYSGAPVDSAPYVFVCDAFYEVASGGVSQQVGDREIRVAFESPAPRGFDAKAPALAAAREHVRTQFARIGVAASAVDIAVSPAQAGDQTPHRSRS